MSLFLTAVSLWKTIPSLPPSSRSPKAELGGWEHRSKEGNLPTLSFSLLLSL